MSRAHRRVHTSQDLQHIEQIVDAGWRRVSATTGYLSEREARFVMAAAALAPAPGKNLEIGSFKGRSTVGIAYVAGELGLGKVVAVDMIFLVFSVREAGLHAKTCSIFCSISLTKNGRPWILFKPSASTKY